MKKTFQQRFEEKFRITPGCWLWTAGKTKDGYGLVWRDDKNVKAHRASFELYIGPIPDGMHVLHKCDVRNCINPDHFFPGTNADNMADKVAKGRARGANGESHWKAKLTEEKVLAIRADQRIQRLIAADHGVSQRSISLIKRRETWSHV